MYESTTNIVANIINEHVQKIALNLFWSWVLLVPTYVQTYI